MCLFLTSPTLFLRRNPRNHREQFLNEKRGYLINIWSDKAYMCHSDDPKIALSHEKINKIFTDVNRKCNSINRGSLEIMSTVPQILDTFY